MGVSAQKGDSGAAVVLRQSRMRIVIADVAKPIISYIPVTNTTLYIVRKGQEDLDFATLRLALFTGRADQFLGIGFGVGGQNLQKAGCHLDCLTAG